MKILFLARYFYPHVGGVERHIYEVGKGLVKKGHKVTLLTDRFDKHLRSYEEIDGIKIYRFVQPNIKFVGLIFTWIWLLLNIKKISRSDVVHCHDVFIWYLPFRIIFPKKKVFTTFHGWETKFPIPFKNILYKKIANTLSTGTMAIGEYVEKYYKIKTNLISYGAVIMPSKAVKKVRNQLTYVGRLSKDTGLLVLLAALDLLKNSGSLDLKVNFCGDGELKELCSKYGQVHGFTDPRPFLLNSRFLFAAGYLSVLEGLANKCIVFTAYDNELKRNYYELAPFGKWIITSNDPEVIAKKMVRNSISEKYSHKNIISGYNWVKEKSWKKLVKSYLNLWKQKSQSV